MTFKKTRIVWRRTGKEDREDDTFKINPPEVVTQSLIETIQLGNLMVKGQYQIPAGVYLPNLVY